MEFKKAGNSFVKDLASCKAVIASAGFMAISEALYFKKPYFAIPITGQYEQVDNALFLRRLGYGDFSEEVSFLRIKKFLSNLGKYSKRLERYKSEPREALRVLERELERVKMSSQ